MINCTRLLRGDPGPAFRYGGARAPVVFWYPAGYPGEECPPDALGPEEALRLVEEVAEMRSPLLTLEGDDLSRREDLFALVSRASSRGLKTVLATGFRWIGEAEAQRLREAGASYVGLNLDLPGEEGDLPRALEEALPSGEALLRAGLPFGIKVSFRRFHQKAMDELLRVSREKGVRRLAFYQVQPPDGEWEGYRRERKAFMDWLLGEASQGLEVELVTEDHYADGPYLYLQARRSGCGDGSWILGLLRLQGGCGAGRRIVGIGPRGEVHPCPGWRHQVLGRVGERPLMEIWEREALLDRLRRREGFSGRCGRCRFLEVCGGCRVRSWRESGDSWNGDPGCYLDLAGTAAGGRDGG